MADCSNVEVRELLPEHAGSALSVADVSRVDAHLSMCALCTAELALIRTARRALRVTPAIDLGRISSGVIAATAAPSRPQLVASGERLRPRTHRPAGLRWVGWKAAAAIAIAAAGAGSFAVWSSANESSAPPNGASVATAELGVAGGLADVSDGDLQALLGELGDATAGAVADPSFEEPEVVVPSVGVAADKESI
jgi:anti-sigma factor RsiW